MGITKYFFFRMYPLLHSYKLLKSLELPFWNQVVCIFLPITKISQRKTLNGRRSNDVTENQEWTMMRKDSEGQDVCAGSSIWTIPQDKFVKVRKPRRVGVFKFIYRSFVVLKLQS